MSAPSTRARLGPSEQLLSPPKVKTTSESSFVARRTIGQRSLGSRGSRLLRVKPRSRERRMLATPASTSACLYSELADHRFAGRPRNRGRRARAFLHRDVAGTRGLSCESVTGRCAKAWRGLASRHASHVLERAHCAYVIGEANRREVRAFDQGCVHERVVAAEVDRRRLAQTSTRSRKSTRVNEG